MSNGSPGPDLKSSLLYTILGLLVVAGAVTAAMYVLVCKLGQPPAFWLIPIFGAVGGVIGSLMSHDGNVTLLTWETGKSGSGESKKSPSIQPGIIGDVMIGLAGAATVAFLVGGTLNLKFRASEADPQSYLLIIGVSLVAGVFGKKVVETAGSKLLEQVKDAKNAAEAAQEKTKHLNAVLLTNYAEEKMRISIGLESVLQDAKNSVEEAIRLDPNYVQAYVIKARLLKVGGEMDQRKNRIAQHDQQVKAAIEVLDRALEINLRSYLALYDRARFKARVRKSLGDVITDLHNALQLDPKLSVDADKDLYHDFGPVDHTAEFYEELRAAARISINEDKLYLDAYVTEARMLKRQGKLQEAYDRVSEALELHRQGRAPFSEARYPAARYNRACYAALLGHPVESVLRDLRSAIVMSPRLADVAAKDSDFDNVKDNAHFKELLSSYRDPGRDAHPSSHM